MEGLDRPGGLGEANQPPDEQLRLVGRTAFNVAHDFNNLLMVITGYADLVLQRMDPADPNAGFLREIRRAGERATLLNQQLLLAGGGAPASSRLAFDEFSEAPAPAPVPAAVFESGTVLVAEDQAGVRGIICESLRVAGFHVLAADCGEAALEVAAKWDGSICLLVTDLVMPGISGRELSERLTELRPGMKTLYVSGYTDDATVRDRVRLETAEYLGKPFTPDELCEKVRQVLNRSSRSARVLVVDDEEPVRALLCEVLSAAGFTVQQAANGVEAQRALRGESFDLVVTDLVMPECEGIEMIQSVRKEHPEVKIVAVSGAFDGSFLRSAELLGAHAALLKPIAAAKLIETVRRLLG